MPEPVTLVFNAAGEAAIREWRPKTDQGKGEAIHAALSRDGKATLHIEAGPSGCIASWRSRILIDPGKYRFVALAKTKAVAPRSSDTGVGAGIRISRGKRTNKLVADADWTSLEFAFELPNSGEVELICELRADKGEVWFDRDSLRLIKSK